MYRFPHVPIIRMQHNQGVLLKLSAKILTSYVSLKSLTSELFNPTNLIYSFFVTHLRAYLNLIRDF